MAKAKAPAPKRRAPRKVTGKVGAPPLDIDPDQVYELAKIDCTTPEIAAAVGCSEDTLERNFAGMLEKGRRECHRSIRRQQYKLAMDGNPTMLIWLGKVQLGQRETVVNEHTGKDGGPIEVSNLTPEQKAARVQELVASGLARRPSGAVN